MEKIKKYVTDINLPLFWFLFVGTFVVGLFHEPAGALCSVVLLVLTAVKVFQTGKLNIPVSVEAIAVLAVSLGYLVTVLWGVDKYYSLLGFAKFLPLPLFWLYLGTTKAEQRSRCLLYVPLSGVMMTVVSALMTWLGKGEALFSVSGRIGGFFQYPNTFALFLIAGIIIVSSRESFHWQHAVIDVILIFGVFLSGSRTSFIMLILAVLGLVFTAKNKKAKIIVSAGFVLAAAVGIVYFAVTGRHGAIGRFLAISADSGTLLGRLLYFKDALRVIAKHPFGLGYMGYYFAQGSFQTGVYSNQFVHNELLQLLLDIGWIPAVLCIVCAVRALLSKAPDNTNRLVVFVILAHCMLDFDLQFLSIVFLLQLCAYRETSFKEISFKKSAAAAATAALAAVCCVCVLLSAPQVMYLLSQPERAVKLCRYHTMAQVELLQETDALYLKKECAETILKNDKYISNAYSTLAFGYYADGDIEKTIQYKKKAIENARYFTEEYADYCTMLLKTINLYIEREDYDSALFCIKELKALVKTVDTVNASTDKLAYRLTETPDLALPAEYQEAIDYYLSIANQ